MTECVLLSPGERLENSIKNCYYGCIRGDMGNIRCYVGCPYLDRCWVEIKEDDNSKSELQTENFSR